MCSLVEEHVPRLTGPPMMHAVVLEHELPVDLQCAAVIIGDLERVSPPSLNHQLSLPTGGEPRTREMVVGIVDLRIQANLIGLPRVEDRAQVALDIVVECPTFVDAIVILGLQTADKPLNIRTTLTIISVLHGGSADECSHYGNQRCHRLLHRDVFSHQKYPLLLRGEVRFLQSFHREVHRPIARTTCSNQRYHGSASLMGQRGRSRHVGTALHRDIHVPDLAKNVTPIL
mmetsp:Transcript_108277/g.272369  ORF Transcript_108277/g.272369 Transcript_108277/m.272369 type:complete len:230 (-) Transcript_108277:524-1213(-)